MVRRELLITELELPDALEAALIPRDCEAYGRVSGICGWMAETVNELLGEHCVITFAILVCRTFSRTSLC